MIKHIATLEEYNEVISANKGVLFYFSNQKCTICKVLKPQIYNLLQTNFPKIEMIYSDTELYPEIAAQNSIFTVPTIVVFLDKKEFTRKSRHIGLEEFRKNLTRPYDLLFN